MSSKKNRIENKSNEFIKPYNRRFINFKMKPKLEHLDTVHMNDKGKSTQDDKHKRRKLGTYKKAFVQYERIKEQKKQEREAAIKRKMEIKESLDKYKQKKREKFKKLAAKTKKGQPIMKNRIEMMLEQIQSSQ